MQVLGNDLHFTVYNPENLQLTVYNLESGIWILNFEFGI